MVEITAEDGHRYTGPDRPGAVSFVPAHCGRQLVLKGVCFEWASIAIRPDLLVDDLLEGAGATAGMDLAPFSNVQDPFLAALVADFKRLSIDDGGLDATYCETMSRALACYLARRYGRPRKRVEPRVAKLPPWRVRRIAAYIEAHLCDDILVADLARLVGVSAGHLHRAFRATLGVTPLEYINEKRVQRAIAILAAEPISIAELALRVGFLSPSHLTRTFRRVAGRNPSEFRAEMGGMYQRHA
jgi:AraC family transcriptional regulator